MASGAGRGAGPPARGWFGSRTVVPVTRTWAGWGRRCLPGPCTQRGNTLTSAAALPPAAQGRASKPGGRRCHGRTFVPLSLPSEMKGKIPLSLQHSAHRPCTAVS